MAAREWMGGGDNFDLLVVKQFLLEVSSQSKTVEELTPSSTRHKNKYSMNKYYFSRGFKNEGFC